MAEVKLSKNQQKVVDTKNKNILVSAAAGAGKTFVLVKRIIKMITEDNVDIDSLLVVTFSQAAANELRERIAKAINDELSKDKGNKNLQKQAMLLNKASISTMDAFCGNIVRSNFYKTDIDPGYRIIQDKNEISRIQQQVIDELFNEKYENNDKSFIKLVNAYCKEYKDDTIADYILQIYAEACNNPYPKNWIEMCRANYDTKNLGFYGTPTGIIVKNIISECYDNVKSAYRKMQACPIFSKYISETEFILNFCNSIEEKELNEITDFSSFKCNDKISGDDLTKDFLNLYEISAFYINKAIILMKEALNAEEILPLQKPYIDTLIDLTLEFMDKYKAKKLEMKAAEFNDIQHYALEILRDDNGNPTEVAEALKAKYTEIIIDEYQDSNNLQEAIFTAFSRGNNMFMVGDIKQSIYRFRQANPELFKYKYKTFPEDNNSELIQLSENYRSKSCVLDFCNHIFRNLMTDEFGDVDYTPEVELKSTDNKPEIYNKTDIHILENLKDLPDDWVDLTNIEYEALYIAEIVKDILENNENIKPEDIAVLTRVGKGIFYPLLNAFAGMGIPASVENQNSLNSTLEIQTILALLKVIDNPYDNIAVITTLHSHIYNITDEELVKIKLSSESQLFYECMLGYIDANDDTLSKKLKDFDNAIHIFRKFALNNSLSRLISYLYDETGYYTYVSILPNGRQRQSNLKLLNEQAEQFENYNSNNLKEFIDYITDSSQINEATVPGDNNNAVRIVTMHSSKGLEYPIVILGFTGKKLNSSKYYPIIHHKLGFALKYVKSEQIILESPLGNIFKQLLKGEEMSESLRLLYVGLTRAKEKLIVTGVCADKNFNYYEELNILNPVTYCLTKANPSYLDFIMSTLSNKNFDFVNIYKVPWNMTEFLKSNNESKAFDISQSLYEIDTNKDYSGRTKEIAEKLNYIYHNIKGQQLPNKISISEIKRMSAVIPEDTENIFSAIEFPDPSFMAEKSTELNGAARGTIYHCLFEHMDFLKVNTTDDIKNTINSMINSHILKDNEAEIINIKKIEKFIKSNLYTRIQKSGKIFKETPFMMSMTGEEIYGNEYKDTDNQIIVHGIIDLYFIEDNEIVLVDYKTDKVNNHNLNELKDKYKIQLDLYKKALQLNTGMKVKESIIYSVYEDCELQI